MTDIPPEDIMQGREALRGAGINVAGLTDDEVVERCVAMADAMVAFAKAIQPVFAEAAKGMAEVFRGLIPLAELIDEENAG